MSKHYKKDTCPKNHSQSDIQQKNIYLAILTVGAFNNRWNNPIRTTSGALQRAKDQAGNTRSVTKDLIIQGSLDQNWVEMVSHLNKLFDNLLFTG